MSPEPPINVGGFTIAAPPSMSPSSFGCARQCRLRVLLDAGGTPSALPSHPSSYAGTVAHRLLEAAQRGLTGSPPERATLARRWRFEMARIEQRIATDRRKQFDRALIPLGRSCLDLERRRLKAIDLASSVDVASGARGFGSNIERMLTSSDGRLTGKPDRVLFSGSGATLRDYKTGRVANETGVIKDAFVDQMHLYGVLLIEREPSLIGRLTLELVGGDGVKYSFAYRNDYAQELGTKARLELAALNRAAHDLRAGRTTLRDLATVSVSHCGRCQFRPRCPAWLEELDARGAIALGGVVDICGTFVDRHQLSDKLTAARLAGGELVTGLGVPEVDCRSSAVAAARPGDRLRIFNVRPPTRPFAPYVAQATTLCMLAPPSAP